MKNINDIAWKIKVCVRKRRIKKSIMDKYLTENANEIRKTSKIGESIYSPKNIMGI